MTEDLIDLETLLKENRTNHYKLLTIVGRNSSRQDLIVEYLKNHGWQVYDVEERIFKISERIPHGKLKLRIGREIKQWFNTLGGKIVLINANILYSEEMGKINPFNAFKYGMRGNKEGVLFLDARLKGNMAIYSTPDRSDYAEFELNDVLYVNIERVEIFGE